MGRLFKSNHGGTLRPQLGEVRAVLGRGNTGRSVAVDQDYRLAKEWSEAGDKRQLLRHSAADRFRASLDAVRAVEGPMVCVRGRRDNGHVQGWRDMGPPKADVALEGRYNPTGNPALYLCDSEEGVRRELRDLSRSEIVCLQEYRLDAQLLRLADLASPTLDEFVRAVLDIAESCRVEGRRGPSTYAFSQVVASLVAEAGFQGMLVPGVRGDPDFHYRNVVVFTPAEDWVGWSVKDAGFRRLGSS